MADGRRHAFLHMWPAGYKSHLKEWPPEYWACLARELAGRGFSVWLTGSGSDAARNAAFVREQLSGAAHIHSLAGRASLPDLAWLLARADAVISVNTGIMHLAALAHGGAAWRHRSAPLGSCGSAVREPAAAHGAVRLSQPRF